jgi:hypothetical protein
MRPAVKRHLVAFAAAVSLLGAASAALWWASHQRTWWIAYGHGEASYEIRAVDGVILAGRVMLPNWEQRHGLTVGSEAQPHLNRWLMWPAPSRANRLGFGLVWDGSTRRAAPWDVRFVMLPFWAVLGALAAIQTGAALRPRGPLGRCSTCGYDLRATPERCPECGAAPAATAAR